MDNISFYEIMSKTLELKTEFKEDEESIMFIADDDEITECNIRNNVRELKRLRHIITHIYLRDGREIVMDNHPLKCYIEGDYCNDSVVVYETIISIYMNDGSKYDVNPNFITHVKYEVEWIDLIKYEDYIVNQILKKE